MKFYLKLMVTRELKKMQKIQIPIFIQKRKVLNIIETIVRSAYLLLN